ncbi:hypothetical protein [Chroococcidiopsis sp.]|uniref:hypothetical protein n=1 Tax=Chroococcidiopsis sp. TaxID=3088168 RepID=UPI003F353078
MSSGVNSNLNANSLARECLSDLLDEAIAYWIEVGEITDGGDGSLGGLVSTWLFELDNYTEYNFNQFDVVLRRYPCPLLDISIDIRNAQDVKTLVSTATSQILHSAVHSAWKKLISDLEGMVDIGEEKLDEWKIEKNINSGRSKEILKKIVGVYLGIN